MKNAYVLVAVAWLASASASAAPLLPDSSGDAKGLGNASLSLGLMPGVSLPIGESASLYTLGGGGQLTGEITFSALPLLFARVNLGYGYAPLQYLRSVSLTSGSLGVGLQWDMTPWLALRAFGSGGAYYGFMNSPVELESSVFPYLSGGAGVAFKLGPAFSILLGASYDNYFGLYQGISASLGASYLIGARQPASVRIRQTKLDDIFPVFYKYYDDHPLGQSVIENHENAPLTDVTATLQIREYMDAPKACDVPTVIRPGESQKITLFGLFKDKVLDITEGTKVPVEIHVEYTLKGERLKADDVQTIRILDRNAMTWDDDRRPAAFVTVKDPQVLSFAKNVLATVAGKASTAIDKNLLIAIAVHQTLSLYGMGYSPDPSRPYAESSKNKQAADFLQFPRQTLEYRAGDCDDLSILTTALMESLGVETAFITIPGHIYMAFALDMDEQEARKTFLRPADLIFHSGKAWVPVEITLTREGFLDSWSKGAQEWHESSDSYQAAFYPVREAWKTYEPVGLPGSSSAITMPSESTILASYTREVARFVERELADRVRSLQDEMKRSGTTAPSLNKLGVLYARYGQVDKAEQQFQKILAKEEFVPALLNLGNLYSLRGETPKALSCFTRAYQRDPKSPSVLVKLLRTYDEMGDQRQVESTLARLKELAPDVAQKYAHLGGGTGDSTRAGAAGAPKGRIEWIEE